MISSKPGLVKLADRDENSKNDLPRQGINFFLVLYV